VSAVIEDRVPPGTYLATELGGDWFLRRERPDVAGRRTSVAM
jgi:hypothetical protein